jgi:hypothetical protein
MFTMPNLFAASTGTLKFQPNRGTTGTRQVPACMQTVPQRAHMLDWYVQYQHKERRSGASTS